MSKFIPREYQKLIISHIIAHPRCALFVSMGMGKTSSTLAALEYLKAMGEPVRALVLAPLRVASSTWPDEVVKWGFDLRVSVVTGTPARRRSALQADADVYTCNYETVPWLIAELGTGWNFTVIVADESTRLKGFRLGGGGGSRARALSRVAFAGVNRFIELTGTPAANGLLDLWGQCWFLDRGARLERSFGAFTGKYFRQRRCGSSPFAVTYEPLDWTQEAIQERLRDVCLSLDAADYFPIDSPIEVPVPVELPEGARKVYDRLQRDMYVALDDGTEVDAVNAAALTVKCLQVASGALYREDATWEELHDVKIEALRSIIEESAGAPVLVAYHWKADLERLLKAFPKGRALDKNPRTIKDWNAGKIPVLFAHPASAGHGLNLQDGGHILVFFSHWWDLEQYQQIIERIGPTRQAQAGHPRPVFLYHIIAKDTVDELVITRMKSKRTVQEVLLEALKNNCKAKEEGV